MREFHSRSQLAYERDIFLSYLKREAEGDPRGPQLLRSGDRSETAELASEKTASDATDCTVPDDEICGKII